MDVHHDSGQNDNLSFHGDFKSAKKKTQDLDFHFMALDILFSVMCSLEMLYLGGNLISSIPPEVANLTCLRYLVLCDNRIQSVPPQLNK